MQLRRTSKPLLMGLLLIAAAWGAAIPGAAQDASVGDAPGLQEDGPLPSEVSVPLPGLPDPATLLPVKLPEQLQLFDSTGAVRVDITNTKIPVAGSFEITALPPLTVNGKLEVASLPPLDVSIKAAPPLSIGSLPRLDIGSLPPITGKVDIGSLPLVNVGSLPPVDVRSLPPVNIGSLPPVSVASLPKVEIGSLPSVNIGSLPPVTGTVNIGSIPPITGTVNIGSLPAITATIANPTLNVAFVDQVPQEPLFVTLRMTGFQVFTTAGTITIVDKQPTWAVPAGKRAVITDVFWQGGSDCAVSSGGATLILPTGASITVIPGEPHFSLKTPLVLGPGQTAKLWNQAAFEAGLGCDIIVENVALSGYFLPL